jgi:plastocyanin
MNRRDFLRTAGGAAGGAAAAGAAQPAAAGDEEATTDTPGPGTTTAPGTAAGGTTTAPGTTNGTATGTSGGASGPTKEVVVGPGGSLVYEPVDLTIAPGTTVKFVWDSDNHNIVVDSQPDGANWEGTPGSDTYNTGYEYSHTFETTGTYEYYCQPHLSAGMEASITVQEGGAAAGGAAELDPHEMGVPFQAHYVGAATMLAIVVSLVFAFYLLKYGESPHASSPNRD